ncbi:3-isopropylmalate dehydrogenase [Sphaerobacter sp.]|uniref:3-isopropylmalate dehydrogenase n=1 Tax=Sphaerobacter sp. TaxID=2099654 RepID=UPI001D634ECA|nr:3-isopropylmalate dehydrogenase [Sphaerobacter sp.]MBX5446512.1 3-isopropylmalate dehydrogenase [Sphaerobacter sp.]
MSERTFHILLLPGDGVGPEVTAEARALLEAVGSAIGARFVFTEGLIGGAAIDAYGTPLRDEEIDAALASDAVFLGAVGGPAWDHLRGDARPESGLLRLRKALGLFANLRPVRVFDALVDASPLKPEIARGADLLVVRELTGGLYFGRPSERRTDEAGRRAIDTLPYADHEIERIVDLAFRLARQRRRKVTSIDKANVLATSQLWREVATEVAERYPDVTLEHMLVDAGSMRLIARPADFDVLVTENLFGDILSDEAGVLAGSLGMLPSASLNGEPPTRPGTVAPMFGLYEPVHGSAPDIAGQGLANPLGAILSVSLMLRFSFGLADAADAIEAAVDDALSAGYRTRDIGGTTTTAELGAQVRERALARLGG